MIQAEVLVEKAWRECANTHGRALCMACAIKLAADAMVDHCERCYAAGVADERARWEADGDRRVHEVVLELTGQRDHLERINSKLEQQLAALRDTAAYAAGVAAGEAARKNLERALEKVERQAERQHLADMEAVNNAVAAERARLEPVILHAAAYLEEVGDLCDCQGPGEHDARCHAVLVRALRDAPRGGIQ